MPRIKARTCANLALACYSCCQPVARPRAASSALVLYVVQGPRMVRDVFRLAKENAPAIIFIDEVDAIATARFDAQVGARHWGPPK